MNPAMRFYRSSVMLLATVALSAFLADAAAQTVLHPSNMTKIAQVNPRYVSYNVEAIEVTGGRFWKPFPKPGDSPVTPPAVSKTPADPYQYRPPINLSNPKLRKLASALAPSYIRVSGTWQNGTFFQNDDASAPLATPPPGYKGVMTRSQWKGVVDFSHATGAEIVTSVAISDGARSDGGNWFPDQAKAFFDYNKKIGGHIAAVEFMNEPTFPDPGFAPKGYNAAWFARDIHTFQRFLRAQSPQTIFLGPGSIGEGVPMLPGTSLPMPKMLSSEEMLKATGPIFDAFSYHFYTTLSSRCVGKMGLSWEKVLTPEYLDRNPDAEAFYAKLRDSYLTGKPIWLTETGEAGCGGNPWASSFVDTFRFADQLGVLAQKNVQTVIVNTLASSDYGLLDENTYNPRPDYWIALLWKRLMGTNVLDPAIKPTSELRLYAQCMKDSSGGVTLLALNLDQKSEHALSLPIAGDRYTLTAPELLSESILLNGTPLKAEQNGTLPPVIGVKAKAGELPLPPASITFFVMPDAKNPACR